MSKSESGQEQVQALNPAQFRSSLNGDEKDLSLKESLEKRLDVLTQSKNSLVARRQTIMEKIQQLQNAANQISEQISMHTGAISEFSELLGVDQKQQKENHQVSKKATDSESE